MDKEYGNYESGSNNINEEFMDPEVKRLVGLLTGVKKYPVEDIDRLFEKIKSRKKKRELSEGDWCQVFTGDKEPVYAKIKKIHDNSMVVLYGIYGYNEDLSKYEIAFPLDTLLPIDDTIGRMLEYANRNNTVMSVGGFVYG